MSLTIQNNNVSFASKNSFIRGAKKALTKEEQILEQTRGMMAGIDAKKRGVDECKEVIIRETLSGNIDFIKGFNKIIGEDMAKKAYSLIGK